MKRQNLQLYYASLGIKFTAAAVSQEILPPAFSQEMQINKYISAPFFFVVFGTFAH